MQHLISKKYEEISTSFSLFEAAARRSAGRRFPKPKFPIFKHPGVVI
jgi:hypothetical protein